MKRGVTLTLSAIDEAALIAQRTLSSESGAVAVFLGTVRGTEAGVVIDALEYEAFHTMAERQFNLLLDQVERRWPVESVRLVHRVGTVKTGEASLWVEIIAPHRREAFEACQWLIDEMKRVVPIWKRPLPSAP